MSKRQSTRGTHYCAYVKCQNAKAKQNGKSFFKFPKDAGRCKQWVKNCGRIDLFGKKTEQLKNYYVCSGHFEKKDFTNNEKNRLNWTAVPKLPMDIEDSLQYNCSSKIICDDEIVGSPIKRSIFNRELSGRLLFSPAVSNPIEVSETPEIQAEVLFSPAVSNPIEVSETPEIQAEVLFSPAVSNPIEVSETPEIQAEVLFSPAISNPIEVSETPDFHTDVLFSPSVSNPIEVSETPEIQAEVWISSTLSKPILSTNVSEMPEPKR